MTITTSNEYSIQAEQLFSLRVRFGQMQMFPSPFGARAIAVVEHGTASGPRLNGTVLPGGGDWLTIGADGIARVDVRATLQLENGDHVLITNTGRVVLSDEARDRFLAGETLLADDMFARTAPLFETTSEEFGWLNAVVAVGLVTQLSVQHIEYDVLGLQ
jgi:hypothetical protein